MSGDSNTVASESHAQIKDAELAYFKLQDILKTPSNSEKPRPSSLTSYRSLQPILEQRRAEQAGQTEIDFTLPGNQGTLGCPFAGNRTPRSSRSHSEVGGMGRRSKRASFHDPLTDGAKPHIAVSSVASIESETGPACPIRFLDQHSPEDIAKYFEQHKHELPRSHEVCVKRFQSNAESIKHLDAKYGSLVNMIQDLGQKHKPMLPEAPADDDDIDDEDPKSHQNIENWAKTVGDDVANGVGDVVDTAPVPQEDIPDDQERLQRFDRPMKEIRVGESPSRPWGVPIPARFLDRTTSFAHSIARAPLETATDLTAAPPKPDESTIVHVPKASELPKEQTTAERPRGKCPFDHMAMRSKPMTEAVEAPLADVPVVEAPLADVPAKVTYVPHQPKPVDERVSPGDDHDSELTIINHGIAIIGNSQSFKSHRLVNHGTLIMGYGAEAMNQALAQIMK